MSGWNGWYHCMTNTYGTWLPGDPRGFRTRKHREHVQGDYKSPPPKGPYDDRHAHAKELLKRNPVVLSVEAREMAADAIRHALVDVHHIKVLAIAVGATHIHLLARFPAKQRPTDSIRGLRASDPVRHFVDIAKKESARQLSKAGLAEPGGVWSKRGKIVPLKDRQHQLNVYRYIIGHKREGAVVWRFNDV